MSELDFDTLEITITELVEFEWYLVKSKRSGQWSCLQYLAFNDGADAKFVNNHFYVNVDECEQIIPLELAIRAEELQAENERLRAQRDKLFAALAAAEGGA